MPKLNLALIILLVGAITQLFVGWNANTITMLIVGAGLLIGVLSILRITINGVNNTGKGAIILSALILGILILFGVSAAGILGGAKLPTASIVDQGVQTGTGTGAIYSAKLVLNARGGLDGNAYAGSGYVYALTPGITSDRYDFMKKLYDGTTANILPNAMTLASGQFTKSGYNARIGDKLVFAGYLDTSPAAAENASFYKEVTITGITAGSTPEFMLSDSNIVWYNYPTLLFYDDTDSARTVRTELETVAAEKTVSFSVFPTNNGEGFKDSVLWVEAPEANIAAIKQITITSVDSGVTETCGMPVEISTDDSRFKAQPALTTSTDKMYFACKFPKDDIRISASQKARQNIVVRYDHPASGDVVMYFKITSNTNALTTSGGHIDTPGTNLKLNMTDDGTDGWTT